MRASLEWPWFWCIAALVFGYLPSRVAQAEQFIGVEGQGDEATDDAANAPEEQPKKTPKAKKKPRPDTTKDAENDLGEDNNAEEDRPSSVGDRFSFTLVIGAASHYLSGQAILGYSINRYVGIDTNAFYYRYADGDTTGIQYGPEVDLVLRLPNPTIVTPFIGAGPGYYKWIREYKGTAFDDDSSLTANDLGGIDVALTKHFGLRLMRKQIIYLGSVPRSFDDRGVHESRSQMETDIGFHASF